MSSQFERLAAALAGQYRIVRELGQGGMAVVYLADDLKHKRQVALKVLRPELAATLGSERFLREIETVAGLTHPHILPLYDSGEAGGFLYYVMPYIEGESLRDRLTREGELPVAESVRILCDVVDALAKAHSQGVVHRDIKPDNVLLADRHAVVADFGVAKAVSEATGRDKLTTAGVALGTPAYMSPEQGMADPHIDHRSDIYAVGAVAYELLTGQPPFTAATPQGVLSAHVTEAPEPVTARRPSVSPALSQLVMKCLEKKPADRWQSAEELLAPLEALATPSGGITPTETRPLPATNRRRRVALAGAGLVLLGALATGRILLTGSGPALDPDKAVVAPFENQTTLDSLDVFSDILADYLANQIVRTGLVDVVPSSVVREMVTGDAASGTSQGLAEATGAGILISGSYFVQGDSLVVHAQVIDGNSASVVTPVGPIGAPSSEPMSAAASFARRLLGSLALIKNPDAPPASVAGQVPSYEAYRDYFASREPFLQGRYADALELLYRALRVDSTFAAALLWAGSTEWSNGDIGRADSLFHVAARYREQLAPLDVANLDYYLAYLAGDREAAWRAMRRVVEMAPGPTRTPGAAYEAVNTNRPHEALELYEPHVAYWSEHSGNVRFFWISLTTTRHMLRDHRRELRDAEAGRRANPQDVGSLLYVVRALSALGRVDEARVRFDSIAAGQARPGMDPGSALLQAAIDLRAHEHDAAASEALDRALQWYASLPDAEYRERRSGRAGTLYEAERWVEAEALIDSLRREFPDSVNVHGYEGVIAARLGDAEKALRISEELDAVNRPYVFGTPTAWRARIAAVLGHQAQAVQLLTEAYQRGMPFGIWLLHDRDLDSLRGYAPFQEWIRPRG
jgi:tRNA A-37 threonylcarbamoyl transferase component Bud32/tetratricopeptide (TPR) repeat protein/TolB-like protein